MSDSNTDRTSRLEHLGDEPHLLREIIRTYQVLVSGFASAAGMPASRFALMRLLAFSDGEVGISDLARQLEVNPAAVSRQIKELEREQLVRRRADERDGRRSFVSLSPAGWALFEQIHERSHQFERMLSADLGEDDVRRTVKVLATLRARIEEGR